MSEPSALAPVSDRFQTRQELVDFIEQQTTQAVEKAVAPRAPVERRVPWVTSGPVGRDSEGYSVLKAAAFALGYAGADQAKEELHVHQQLKELYQTHGFVPHCGHQSFLVPLATEHLPAFEPRGQRLRQEIREKMLALREKAKDLIVPPLVDQIASHLSSENQQKLRSAVDEFYRSNPAPNSPRPGGSLAAPRSREPGVPLRPREEQRIETQQLLRELGRSLRSIVDERRSRFDELVKAVEPTPEQESKIQSILRDQGVAGQLKPTTAQRSESFRKIMDVLTPAQRQKLREALAR